MSNVNSLSDPRSLLTQVTSKIPVVLFQDKVISVHKNTIFLLSVPSLRVIKEFEFEDEITAIASNQVTIFVGFNLKTNQNSGLVVQYDADLTKMHSISLVQPPHLMSAQGLYLAASFGVSTRFYLDFKQIQHYQHTKSVSLDVYEEQAVIIYSDKTIILSKDGPRQITEHTPCASLQFQGNLITSGRDNALSFEKDAKVVKTIFMNKKFYSMKTFENSIFAIADDSLLYVISTDNFSTSKELIYEQQYPIFINGKQLQNLIQIEICKNFLIILDYELTITIIDLSALVFEEDQVFSRSFSAQSSQFGEILSIQKFTTNFAFSASSTSFYIFNEEKSSHFCNAYAGHDDVVTHLKTITYNDQNLIISVSSNQILFWREEEIAQPQGENFLHLTGQNKQLISLSIFLELTLPTNTQITAFDVILTKTRAILTYATSKQILTLELFKFLQFKEPAKCEPNFEKITAHMDFVNDLKFLNAEILVSCSADKSVCLWNVGHVIKEQKTEQISIFDIFTGKIDKKRGISVDGEMSKIQLVQQMLGFAKRTIWGISVYGKFLAIACGDKRVRIVKVDGQVGKIVKVIENFTFPVVRAQFINDKQVICLQNNGIISVNDFTTGEVNFILGTEEFCQDILTTKTLKKSVKTNEDIESETTNFGAFSFFWDDNAILIGTSNGKILEMYDNTEEKNLIFQQEKMQQILELQLFNNALSENKYPAAVQLAIRSKDDKLLFEAITSCLVKNITEVDFSEYKLGEFWQLLRTSVRWLKMAKKAQQGVFLLDNMMNFCRISVLKEAYGQSCELQINEGIRLLEKHRERVGTQRGQVRMINIFDL